MSDVPRLRAIIESDTIPSLPNGWENELFWLQPSTGKIHKWNGSSWGVIVAPLIVVPSEVTLDTELDARMLAHEALPNVHHAESHTHSTFGDIGVNDITIGRMLFMGEYEGVTAEIKTEGGTLVFKNGVLIKYG